jgi:hypothetical protein
LDTIISPIIKNIPTTLGPIVICVRIVIIGIGMILRPIPFIENERIWQPGLLETREPMIMMPIMEGMYT